MRILAVAVLAFFAAQEARSQTAYKYDVVSIHKAEPGQTSSGFGPGAQGGMRARNVTALAVIAFSYNVPDFQVEGVPAWAKSERFEISFTPEKAEIVPGQETSRAALDGWLDRQRQRMQAVLQDRFQLKQHMETRELPSYVLTTAKGGHKLGAPEHPERTQSMNINNGQRLIATSAPTKALADALKMILGRPVRDETGIEGTFDFKMEWAPEPGMPLSRTAAEDDSARASIFTALTEQLGLRLESRKAPTAVLVIDGVERPGEN
jgi:bla regulator protein BlaR1